MRGLPFACALLLLCACDAGEGAPCVLDSDCADFSLVCLDSVCREPGGVLRDGGEAGDAGEAETDAGGGGTDAGPREDAGPFDGGPVDAAPIDAAPEDAAAGDDAGPFDGAIDASADASSTCFRLVDTWVVTDAVGNCSDLLGATVSFTPGGLRRCSYAVDSTNANGPSGEVTTTPDGGVSGELMTGGFGGASQCDGSVMGGVMTLTCSPIIGACDLTLTAS